MNTCMVRANFYDENKKVNDPDLWEWQDALPVLFMLIPFVLCIIGFYDAFKMIRKLIKGGDNNQKKVFITYGSTLILNFFVMLLMVGLYLSDLFTDYKVVPNEDIIPSSIRWLSYFLTLFTVINPFLIGLVQISQYFFDWNSLFNRSDIETSINKNIGELSEVLVKHKKSGFDQLQEASNQHFLSNVYLSVAYCMEKNKMKDKNIINDILSNEETKSIASSSISGEQNDLIKTYITETTQYKITNTSINELQHSEIQNDAIVQNQEYIKINCEEHAPIIFRCLREIDGVNEDLVISSCLPSLNKELYEKSQGRSGSFFLGTHNKEFLIKSINEKDIKFIKEKLLKRVTEFFYQHKQSIISRLYGVYTIKINSQAYHFILMKDVCGMFQQNIISKYDLKGSQLNRDVDLEIDHVEKQVLKDINFKQNEGALRLRVNDVKTLIASIENDVVFLANNGVMDYSLLVVNIDLNPKETEMLFGRNHAELMRYEYQQRMGDIIGGDNDEIPKIEELTEEEKDELFKQGEVKFNWRNVSGIKKHLFPTLNGNKAVILAIIDYFQEYTFDKKLETDWKRFKGNKAENISSMPAHEYVKRFLENILPIIKGEGLLKDSNSIN